MSIQYDQYLKRHKENVCKGFKWLLENLPHILRFEEGVDLEWQICMAHDQSKTKPDEYDAYDAYFYGGNRSFQVVQNFNRAWLTHIHRNPHHWQHWILINDDPEEGTKAIDMPTNYIIEMICDWWSFSWSTGNLTEIFDWYDKHKSHIRFHSSTRGMVEYILHQMQEKLSPELAHHGIKGQKWGVTRTPEELARARGVENPPKSDTIRGKVSAHISEDKFINYALDYSKAPDKARAFETALGYTKENHKDLIDDIDRNLSRDDLVEKGDDGYGMRYEQVMKLTGPNGKEANVLTAWIEENDDELRLTSAYVTRKEPKK